MAEGTPALAAQLDLIEWNKTRGSDWARWFLSTTSGQHKVLDAGGSLAGMREALGLVEKAETIFVSRDMCDVIEKAAAEMPDIPIQFENLMWPTAFVYFERPINHQFKVTEGDAKPLRTRALLFTHFPSILQSETEESRKPGIVHLTYIDIKDTEFTYEDLGGKLFPYDLSAWTYGKRWETVPHGESEWGSKVDEGLAQQRKLLLAVNLIAAQRIAIVSKASPSRQQRRRAERMGRADVNEIAYVTLRRARQRSESSNHDASDFEYSHRFIVSGHWRHQFYPSREEHELIWIDPFVKGPEEKPLVVKDKVWKLSR